MSIELFYFGIPVVRTDGRSVYGHVITYFSGMDRFSYPWCSAAGAREPRYKERITRYKYLEDLPDKFVNCIHKYSIGNDSNF